MAHEVGKVHHYTRDPLTGRAGLTRVTPERHHLNGSEHYVMGHDGLWYTQTGVAMDARDVPAWAHAAAEASGGRPTFKPEGVAAMIPCRECGEVMDIDALQEHLAAHFTQMPSIDPAAMLTEEPAPLPPRRPGRPPKWVQRKMADAAAAQAGVVPQALTE